MVVTTVAAIRDAITTARILDDIIVCWEFFNSSFKIIIYEWVMKKLIMLFHNFISFFKYILKKPKDKKM